LSEEAGVHTVQVEGFDIEPDLDDAIQEIAPGTGTFRGRDGIERAYVGVSLQSKVKDSKTNTVRFRRSFWLITSDKQLLLANDSALAKEGLVLKFKPIAGSLSTRWKPKHIKEFQASNSPIDPVEVFQHQIETGHHYIEYPTPEDLVYRTLWNIGSYFHQLFDSYPYHYIGGIKASGKTKVLVFTERVGFNAYLSGNTSEASMYRTCQNASALWEFDEQENLSDPKRQLAYRNLLLSGYKKGATVYRCEKTTREKIVPEDFQIYGPKSFANITGLDSDVLEDRCVLTFMRKSKNRAVMNRQITPESRDPTWAALRDELYRLYLQDWATVRELYEELLERFDRSSEPSEASAGSEPRLDGEYVSPNPTPTEICGREAELWVPILTLAAFFDASALSNRGSQHSEGSLPSLNPCPLGCTDCPGSLYHCMVRFAVNHAKERRVENITETAEYILLQTLAVEVQSDGWFSVKQLRDSLASHFDEAQTWLNTMWIGRRLRTLGFKQKRRVGTGYEYWLSVDQVKDLVARLQIELPNGENNGQLDLPAKLEAAKAWLRGKENVDADHYGDRLAATEKFGANVLAHLEHDGDIESHLSKPNKIRLVRG